MDHTPLKKTIGIVGAIIVTLIVVHELSTIEPSRKAASPYSYTISTTPSVANQSALEAAKSLIPSPESATVHVPNPVVPARYAFEVTMEALGQPTTWEQGSKAYPAEAQRVLDNVDKLGRKGDLCTIEDASHSMAIAVIQQGIGKQVPTWTTVNSETLLGLIVEQYC